MNEKPWLRVLKPCSDNPKSKIANPKWLGLSVIAFVLLVAGAVAQAQQPTKIPLIERLSRDSSSENSARTEAFRQGLRELEYVEGENIIIEHLWAEGKLDRFPALAAELMRLVEQPMKFEFIINLKAAKQIGLTIPPNVLVEPTR